MAKNRFRNATIDREKASVRGCIPQTSGCIYFRLLFPYTPLVWNLPQSQFSDFAVRRKGCGETIPAPVGTMPDTWIVADCPLCGMKRRYLPTEIFQGALSPKLLGKQHHAEVFPWVK